jgi:hypothetical protein
MKPIGIFKKSLAFILCALMAVSLGLTGCSKKETQDVASDDFASLSKTIWGSSIEDTVSQFGLNLEDAAIEEDTRESSYSFSDFKFIDGMVGTITFYTETLQTESESCDLGVTYYKFLYEGDSSLQETAENTFSQDADYLAIGDQKGFYDASHFSSSEWEWLDQWHIAFQGDAGLKLYTLDLTSSETGWQAKVKDESTEYPIITLLGNENTLYVKGEIAAYLAHADAVSAYLEQQS